MTVRFGSQFLVFAVSMVLLTGCVSKQAHEDKLYSWLGAKEGELVADWGPPTSFYKLDDRRFLIYSNSSQACLADKGWSIKR